MELRFLVTLSLSWHSVCVYSLCNRYEVMKQRREVQNNDHNIKVLFTLWFLENRERMKESAVLYLPLVHLWPRLAPFNTPQLASIAPSLLEGNEGCEKHVM